MTDMAATEMLPASIKKTDSNTALPTVINTDDLAAALLPLLGIQKEQKYTRRKANGKPPPGHLLQTTCNHLDALKIRLGTCFQIIKITENIFQKKSESRTYHYKRAVVFVPRASRTLKVVKS